MSSIDSETLLAAIFFLFGSVLGSFANVVIYRLPLGQSVVHPRSRCPQCQKMVAWYDNIPIVSWFLLKGKCRGCKKSISWRYPLVEFLTGILFCGLFLTIGLNWTLLEYIIFGYMLIICTFIDFDHMILPDIFTLGGIVLGLFGAALNPEREFMPAFWGVLMGGGFLWAIAYIYLTIRKEDGMGGGDIKLLGWVGAVLGWKAIPFVILSSSLIGSLVGLVLMLKTKGGMKLAIPFGPYLALGSVLYIFGGDKLADWYLNIFLMNPMP